MSVTVQVSISGMDHFDDELQRFRNAIADRRPLHAEMAVQAANFTRDYLIKTPRHKTALALGASPTGFRAKNAKAVQADSNDSQALVRIPRSTGLGRAFGDVVIRPGSGRKYLTLPAHADSYGKSVRDFPEETFKFTVINSWQTFLALTWAEDGGRHKKGEVAYWLRRSVKQLQDRTLLPSDDGYAEVGRRAGVAYIANRIYHST